MISALSHGFNESIRCGHVVPVYYKSSVVAGIPHYPTNSKATERVIGISSNIIIIIVILCSSYKLLFIVNSMSFRFIDFPVCWFTLYIHICMTSYTYGKKRFARVLSHKPNRSTGFHHAYGSFVEVAKPTKDISAVDIYLYINILYTVYTLFLNRDCRRSIYTYIRDRVDDPAG